jgi:hypothetical protein
MSVELPPDVVDRLSRFVPRSDLQAMRVHAGAPLRWMPVLLNTGAMTFGRHVLFRAGRFRIDTPRGLALIAHECGHIGQYREIGFFRFIVRYLRGQFQCRFRHDLHPMEAPMIALQRRVRQELERAEA